jgi:hypothetical protein
MDYKGKTMKIQDVLRRVADMMDTGPESMSDEMPNQAAMTAVDVDHDDETAPETMVSPLQQELELMKKAAGIDSAYDDSSEEECGCDHESSEPDADLDALRHMAGIKIVR